VDELTRTRDQTVLVMENSVVPTPSATTSAPSPVQRIIGNPLLEMFVNVFVLVKMECDRICSGKLAFESK